MSGSGTWSTGTWGLNQWNDSANPTFTVTGIAFTATLGDEATVGEINTGWGRQNWGDAAWGIAGNFIATGQGIAAALGTPTISIDVSTGPSTNNNQLITAGLGSLFIDTRTVVFPTGLPLTAAEGTADAGPDAMATGIAMSMGVGTVDAFNTTGWGRLQWGINDWGDAGSSIIVSVTGIAMTAALGNETITGSATLTLNTLNVAQATLGIVDPAPDAGVTGNLITANLGTAVGQAGAGATPSGIAMTAGLGTAVGVPGQVIVPTGFPVEARLSSAFNILIHVDVSVTGLGLTMNQGSGNALIWNEVNTGSAPITPPGWQEVAA